MKTLILLLTLGLLISSCNSMKYSIRQHKNQLSQLNAQTEHCRPACKDPGRMFRNQDQRPKGSWPIEFLQ